MRPSTRTTAVWFRRFATVIWQVAVAVGGGSHVLEAQASSDSTDGFGDPYTQAAGLRPLRLDALPRGVREIRAWVGGGFGWPQELYRLVERGGRFRGEYIRYWNLASNDNAPDSLSFAALLRYHEQGRCEPVRRGRSAESCRALFQTEPDWKAVWRAADSLGVWTLPDASTLRGGRHVLDGWGITVELRDGPTYRIWHYSNPDAQPWPEAARASAFANALEKVSSRMRRSAAERVYAGRIEVRGDTLEFSPCTGGGPWLLQVYDPRLTRRGTTDTTASPSRRVDVRGTLVPEWVARDWWNVPPYFKRTLQGDSVLAVLPWAPNDCPRAEPPAR